MHNDNKNEQENQWSKESAGVYPGPKQWAIRSTLCHAVHKRLPWKKARTRNRASSHRYRRFLCMHTSTWLNERSSSRLRRADTHPDFETRLRCQISSNIFLTRARPPDPIAKGLEARKTTDIKSFWLPRPHRDFQDWGPRERYSLYKQSIRADILETISILNEGQTTMQNTLERVLNAQPAFQISSNYLQDSKVKSQTSSTPHESIEVSVVLAGYPFSGASCRCRRKRMSRYLRSRLGNLFIGYVAAPVNSQHERQCCLCTSESELALVYYFPPRFLNYILSLNAKYSGLTSIMFSLSVTQHLPQDHIIWFMGYSGDIKGMQRLFSSGQVSIKAQSTSSIGLFWV